MNSHRSAKTVSHDRNRCTFIPALKSSYHWLCFASQRAVSIVEAFMDRASMALANSQVNRVKIMHDISRICGTSKVNDDLV